MIFGLLTIALFLFIFLSAICKSISREFKFHIPVKALLTVVFISFFVVVCIYLPQQSTY